MNAALDRAERAYAAQRSATAEAARQTRTPLVVLVTHAELMQGRRTAEALGADVAALERTVDQLLALAAVGGAQTGRPGEPVDLVALARLAANVPDPPAAKRGVDLASGAAPCPVLVLGHESPCMQNAITAGSGARKPIAEAGDVVPAWASPSCGGWPSCTTAPSRSEPPPATVRRSGQPCRSDTQPGRATSPERRVRDGVAGHGLGAPPKAAPSTRPPTASSGRPRSHRRLSTASTRPRRPAESAPAIVTPRPSHMGAGVPASPRLAVVVRSRSTVGARWIRFSSRFAVFVRHGDVAIPAPGRTSPLVPDDAGGSTMGASVAAASSGRGASSAAPRRRR